MLKIIEYALIIMTLLISPTGTGLGYSIGGMSLYKYDFQKQENVEKEKKAAEEKKAQEQADAEAHEKALHTFTDYKRAELTDYCTFKIPYSHFKPTQGKVGKTLHISYAYDELSYIDISYATNITESQIDNFASDLCKIDGTESDVSTDSVTIKKVTGEVNESNYKEIGWAYIHNQSAMIINAYVDANTDSVPLEEAVEDMLKTVNVYYVSAYAIETPTTGYYSTDDFQREQLASEENNEETSQEGEDGTTSGEEEISSKSAVTTSVTWSDFDIVIGDSRLELPCKLSKLTSMGYSIYTSRSDTLKANETQRIELAQDNGIGIVCTIKNFEKEKSKIDNCTVISIDISKEYLSYFVNGEYTEDNLPELSLLGNFTWDAMERELESALGDSCRKTANSDGSYTLSISDSEKKMQIITDNYRDILSIHIEYNGNLLEDNEEDAEADRGE